MFPKPSVYLLIVNLWYFALPTLTQCPLSTQRLSYSVLSHRNQTGHWRTKLLMKNEVKINGYEYTRDLGTWGCDVNLSTTVCDNVETVHILTSVTVPPPRVTGYEFFPGIGFYKHHKEARTWDDAQKTCVKEGAHLAIINSEEESAVIMFMMSRAPEVNQWAFVGFHDRFVEGQYLTIFGEPLANTGFKRWSSSGQPDNYGGNSTYPGEDCGSIHRNGGLNDLPCSAKISFFCEQELW
ncbi:hemolymph lipopolysaccharide-binding protein [Anabrus simplex]|uniref:hemolymph lipopolysaccharide-binding protein n=1 Tax=Anabrus simplex TaxID=316456 RepID=UPI0035A2CE68